MSDSYRSQFVRQLLGDKAERTIGDFVLFKDEVDGEVQYHCLSIEASKHWHKAKQTGDFKTLKPILKAEKRRLREVPSYAPISDEDLENIE